MTIGAKITAGLASFCLFMAMLSGNSFAQASAQMQCGVRDDVVRMLAQKFHEVRRSTGLINDTAAVELFVSPKQETWTLLLILPNRGACILAGGSNWESTKPPAGDLL
jgi:hypothetical protein